MDNVSYTVCNHHMFTFRSTEDQYSAVQCSAVHVLSDARFVNQSYSNLCPPSLPPFLLSKFPFLLFNPIQFYSPTLISISVYWRFWRILGKKYFVLHISKKLCLLLCENWNRIWRCLRKLTRSIRTPSHVWIWGRLGGPRSLVISLFQEGERHSMKVNNSIKYYDESILYFPLGYFCR